MNFLDLIIIVGVIIGFFVGWKLRAINLFGIALALVAGIWFANQFHPHILGLYRDLPATVASTCAWLTVFLATVITVSILSSLASKMFELSRLQWIDRLLGALLAAGVVLGLLIIGLNAADNLAKTYKWRIIEHSLLAPELLNLSRPLIQQGVNKIPSLKNSI
jgi:membrane protein required for colicin V production